MIETPAAEELRRCFIEHCLKRLERYVVPVTFVDTADRTTSDISRLMTDPGRARVAQAVAKLADNDKIELVSYSKRLIGILDERSGQFEASLGSLRLIAEKTKDRKLFANLEVAERKFAALRQSEEQARKKADEERKAKEEAQARAAAAENSAKKIKEELEEEKKRNLFLTSISSLDSDTIINLHHQITIYSVDVHQQIENFILESAGKTKLSIVEVFEVLEKITLLNQKVLGISKFATKANFRLASEKITEDFGEYVAQYVNGIASELTFGPPILKAQTDSKGFSQPFKPIDVSVVIDNLVSNSRKALATKVDFLITHPEKNVVHLEVSDNGNGFDKRISDLTRIFEKGYTLSQGSGLGLYHVKLVLGEMNATIEAFRNQPKGAKFLIRIAK